MSCFVFRRGFSPAPPGVTHSSLCAAEKATRPKRQVFEGKSALNRQSPRPVKSASLYSENGLIRPCRCRPSHLWPVTLHKPRSSERFPSVLGRRPPRPGNRPAVPGYTRPRPPYTAAPARAVPASAPESRRIPPAPAARQRARPAPPRPTRGLCGPHAAKPRPRPVGGPPPGRNAPASRTESARRAARHSARSPPSRQKPARVRPAEAHRRLFAAPARLRHSRRPRRRVPLCPQGGIESLGCSGWRPRPPLA